MPGTIDFTPDAPAQPKISFTPDTPAQSAAPRKIDFTPHASSTASPLKIDFVPDAQPSASPPSSPSVPAPSLNLPPTDPNSLPPAMRQSAGLDAQTSASGQPPAMYNPTPPQRPIGQQVADATKGLPRDIVRGATGLGAGTEKFWDELSDTGAAIPFVPTDPAHLVPGANPAQITAQNPSVNPSVPALAPEAMVNKVLPANEGEKLGEFPSKLAQGAGALPELAALGPVAIPAMGASMAGEDTQRLQQEGMSPGKSLALGTGGAIAKSALFSLGPLGKWISGAPAEAAPFIAKMLENFSVGAGMSGVDTAENAVAGQKPTAQDLKSAGESGAIQSVLGLPDAIAHGGEAREAGPQTNGTPSAFVPPEAKQPDPTIKQSLIVQPSAKPRENIPNPIPQQDQNSQAVTATPPTQEGEKNTAFVPPEAKASPQQSGASESQTTSTPAQGGNVAEPAVGEGQKAGEAPTVSEQQGTDTTGIAHRVNEAKGLNIPVGDGIGAEESVKLGRQEYAAIGGADKVADWMKGDAPPDQKIRVARAHAEFLDKQANAAADKNGINSPEYQTAAKAARDWKADVIKPMSTEAHRGFVAHQGETAVDTGTFHGIASAYQEAKGKEMTPGETAKAQRLADAAKSADAATDTAGKKLAAAVAEHVTESAPVKSLADRIVGKLDAAASAAVERIRVRHSGRLSAGIDPADLADLTIYGAAKLAKGVTKFADWSAEMVKDTGEWIKPHLQQVFNSSDDHLNKMVQGESEHEENVKQVKSKPLDKNAPPEKIAARASAKSTPAQLANIAKQLSRAFIRSGVVDREANVDAVHDVLSKAVPGMTREQTSDAMSGYGNFRLLSKDPVEVRRREIAGEVQKTRQLQDMASGQAPKKSGIERQSPTPDARDLTKRVNEAKKAGGYITTDPETQLRTAQNARETYLKNRIVDLQKAIDAGQEISKSKNPSATNPKIESLKTDLAKTKAEYDAKFNPKTVTDLSAHPPGTRMTPERVNALWQKAKTDYIDKGNTNLSDIAAKLATDTGLPIDDIRRGLAAPKGIRQITNEMYAAQSRRRSVDQQAKGWIRNAGTPLPMRVAKGIPGAFFSAKVFGHGTVGMITHAGNQMFDPFVARQYWTNFARQFKYVSSAAGHERAMQDLETSPNFVTARRAGLANDPGVREEYQGGLLGRLKISGGRGFDALKTLRQDLFDRAWDNAPASLKTPEYAKELANTFNHATGYGANPGGTSPVGKFANVAMFAPRLEGSRWGFLLGDPAKAAYRLANWKNQPPEMRSAALREVRQKATIVATYMGALVANQAILSATGSKDKVNFTDPSKSDWLDFKAFGHSVGIISPMKNTVSFFVNMAKAAIQTRTAQNGKLLKDLHGESVDDEQAYDSKKYVRGKLSPFGSVVADVDTHHDYDKRPMPWSSEPVPKYLQREGIGKYTYGEYLTQTFLPIPAEEAMKEVWQPQGVSDSTAKKWLHAIGVAAVAGTTGARINEETGR